jgi:hypothetical protein
MTYTPLRDYLESIIHHYKTHKPNKPASYKRRNSERNFALQNAEHELQ